MCVYVCVCVCVREWERERIARHGFTWILRQEERKSGKHEYQTITLLYEWFTYVTAIHVLGGAFNACCAHVKSYPQAPRLGDLTSCSARLVKFKWPFPSLHRLPLSASPLLTRTPATQAHLVYDWATRILPGTDDPLAVWVNKQCANQKQIPKALKPREWYFYTSMLLVG